MTHPKDHPVQLERFNILAPIPPFVDVILHGCPIRPQEFPKILELAESYPNDPRLIEMVRRAGDASAKVPYLIDHGETAQSILETLREVAAPHVENLKKLPKPVQATIHTLLTINMVPRGYELYGIPALLEIDRIQREITKTLRGIMAGRKLAQEFHENNKKALNLLDQEWAHIRNNLTPVPFTQSLPEHPRMEFFPVYCNGYLITIHEVCVIVDSPDARELRNLTPRVLQKPLPHDEMVPVTGSVDWLLRMVGKVGRHFTRASLEIIQKHLEEEQTHHKLQTCDQITLEAQDAFKEFIESHP